MYFPSDDPIQTLTTRISRFVAGIEMSYFSDAFRSNVQTLLTWASRPDGYKRLSKNVNEFEQMEALLSQLVVERGNTMIANNGRYSPAATMRLSEQIDTFVKSLAGDDINVRNLPMDIQEKIKTINEWMTKSDEQKKKSVVSTVFAYETVKEYLRDNTNNNKTVHKLV